MPVSTRWKTAQGQELWVEGERIVAGGSGPTVDLGEAFVLPGLFDSHLHYLMWCQKREQVDLTGCVSLEDFLTRVARAGPGPWIQGQGFTEIFPTREQLDAVTGGRPALLWRADLHSALANSAALELAGVTAASPDPPGGAIRFEEGRLLELAIGLVRAHIPEPGPDELDRQFRAGARHLLSLGVTAFTDQRIKDMEEGPVTREAFRRLQLPMRIFCNVAAHELGRALPEPSGYATGHVKFFSDGSMGSRTCRMLEPRPWEGIWMSPPDELRAGFARARAQGLPICVHAIGDEAIRVCLDLFAELGPGTGVPDRIEHIQIVHPDDLARVAALGLTASMQPLHLLDDKGAADLLLGERASGYYRLASLAATGVRFAFGSDGPVADVNPWLGMHAAVHRMWPGLPGAWFPDERLSLDRALKGYTREAALAVGRPDLGRLEPGCLADFVVLDRRPTPDNLMDIRVLRTVVGGETVYQA